MTAGAIVNGVHGYMPDNYVVPKEPQVREKLEWLKDQKLALMMHFGMYSQMGVYEFCLFDTKYTDFRVTNPGCPFSKNPCADIVKSVFDATRAEIRLFPALPTAGKGLPVSFRTLRVPGGHSVTASRAADGIVEVRIDPFSDCAVAVFAPSGGRQKAELRRGVPWTFWFR